MATYTDVFGNQTLPPSEYGYVAVTLTANTQLYWPQTTAGSDLVAKIMEVTSSSIGLSMLLPDATEVSVGEDLLVRNVGVNSFSVKDYSGTMVATIASGEAVYLYLSDNSTTSGDWASLDYGVGTSSADAASLVGYGVLAIGSTLNQSHPVLTTASAITIGSTHRAQVVNYTGGAGTLALTAAATLGDNFFCLIRNSGTGTLTLDPNGAETIDGQSSSTLQPGESLILICSGAAWFTVGYGRSVTYNFTQLVLDVSTGTPFTLSTIQAANKLLTFQGNPATAVTVNVPNTVAVYYVLSNISTAQAITVKTAAGTGTAIPQGQRVVIICDGTNVYSAMSVSASSTVSLLDGAVTTPALNFASQTNTGVYKYSTAGFGVAVSGADAFHYDSSTLTVSGSESLSGSLAFTGTGNRITGDFINATLPNRVLFQGSTVNSGTSIGAIPNGSSVSANFLAFNSSTPTNSSYMGFAVSTESQVLSGIAGSGTYLPMTFYTGGSERMRIATNGLATLQGTALGVDSANNGQLNLGGTAAYQGRISFDGQTGTTAMYIDSTYDNASAVMKFRMRTNGSAVTAMTIDGGGNVGVGTSPSTGVRVLSRGSGTTGSTFSYFAQNSSGTTTFAVGDDGTVTCTGNIVSGSATGFRNKIINGNMGVNQRGGTVNAGLTATYGVDRWYALTGASPSGTLTMTQQTGDANSRYCVRLSKTSGTYTGSLVAVQIIESVNCYSIAGRTASLSFRARVGATYTGQTAPIATVYTGTGVDQGNNNIGAWTGFTAPTVTPVSAPTLTTSFQSYKYTVPIGASVSEIAISLGAMTTGSSGSANDYIEITDVQLEEGSVATPFESRPYGVELVLCQRYYYRAQNAGGGRQYGSAWGTTTTKGIGLIQFPVTMRTYPTVLEQSGTASHYAVFLGITNYICNSVPTFGAASEQGAYVEFPNAGTMTVGQAGYANSQSSSGYLGFSAEL